MKHARNHYFGLLLVLVTATTLFSTASVWAAGSTLAGIKQRGELILGTSANMPPMTDKREDGTVVGFDIDMARLMAAGMDVDLKIKTMAFSELLPALEKGTVDVVLSNITINPERNMRVAFVGPYLTSGKCVITREVGIARAEAAENLNSPDIRLAALKGSTSAEFIKVVLPKVTLTTVDGYEDAIKMILDDRTGGLLTDYPVCLSILKKHPDAGFVSLFSLLSYEPIGIALPGSDPLYINWTENFLKRLEGVGALDELGTKWFGKGVVSTRSE